MTDAASTVRLHITPFNPDLYSSLLSSSAQASASNVSYHTLETFPERGYGYVDLPKPEAEKLKKKLNGTTLRGTKMRVEEARPEKKRKADETEDERAVRKKAKREKKVKELGVLEGWGMTEGRHVKRGWSAGKEGKAKKVKKMKDEKEGKKEGKGKKESREGKKVVFKTVVPPNAAEVVPAEKAEGKVKDKKVKKERTGGKKEKVVKEFTKSKKLAPGTASARPALVHEDGKGWTDDAGNVVEAERVSKRTKRERDAMAVDGSKSITRRKSPTPVQVQAESSEADSSIISSDSPESGSEEEDDATPSEATQVAEPAAVREIHPLEALYKRPVTASSDGEKPRPAPIDTSFSFFAAGDSADIEDEETVVQSVHPPQTPHTKQDLEWRALRSAAPTPDTAAIGRKLSFPFAGVAHDDEDSDEQDGETGDAAEVVAGAVADEKSDGRVESEFRKRFFEHRGDNNRLWKKNRKEAKKLVRQRENRRVSRRVM